MPNPESLRISAAEIGRNFGEWQSRAMTAPVVITHHGRDRLVLSSVSDFQTRNEQRAVKPDGDDALIRQRLKLRTLVAHVHECFIAFDADMKVVDANNKAEIFFGMSLEDMLGNDIRRDDSPIGNSISWEYYRRILRLTNEPVSFLAESSIYQGVTLAFTAFPFDGDVGVLFSSTSPHEEAIRRLRRERALLAAVSADPILSELHLSLRGGIMEADQSFAAMSGFSNAELGKMMLADLLHPHDRGGVTRALDAALRNVSSATVETRLLARNGDVHKLRLNFSAVPGDVQSVSAVAIAVSLGCEPA